MRIGLVGLFYVWKRIRLWPHTVTDYPDFDQKLYQLIFSCIWGLVIRPLNTLSFSEFFDFVHLIGVGFNIIQCLGNNDANNYKGVQTAMAPISFMKSATFFWFDSPMII